MLVTILRYNCIKLSLGSCPPEQACIPSTECPFTRQLKSSAELSSNKDARNAIMELISSQHCGEPSDETVCCDLNKGILLLIDC